MSEHLVESILDKNFVLAESLFQEKLNSIMEKKLYEKKRMVAADMNEALGGLTRKEIEDRKKAGYKKASDVLPDPRDIKVKPLVKIKKKVSEAVEVQPDPEGRVRGGKAKRGLSPAQRRIARIGLSAIRSIEKRKKAAASQQADKPSEPSVTAADVVSKAREQKKAAQATRKAAPEPKKKSTDTGYAGAGNTPSAMAGRLKQHIAKKVKEHEPSAPGSGILKVAKGVGRGIGKVARFVANDIAASI